MIVERFREDKVKALYQRFEKEGRLLPKGVKYIDSWIDEDVKTCYQLMESESIAALKEWVDNWSDYAAFEVIPVIDSAAAKKKIFGN